MRLNIRIKLLIPVITSITLLMLVFKLLFVPNYLTHQKNLFIDYQQEILETLQASLVQNILSQDLASLHKTLDRALAQHNKSWLQIKINTPDGKKLYPLVFYSERKNNSTVLTIKQTLTELGVTVADVELSVDWQIEQQKQLKYIQKIEFALISTLLLIAIPAFFWQLTWLITPIRSLKNITRQLAEGRLDNAVSNTGNDELGQLSQDLEKMRNELNKKIVDLSLSRQQAELNQARKDAILNASYYAIITIRANGTIESANIGAEHMFGYNKQHLEGLDITLLIPPTAQYNLLDIVKRNSFDSINQPIEIIAYNKLGLGFPAELAISKVLNNNDMIYTCFIANISDRKELERIKNEFITIIGHELRTPLTSIYGALGLMKLSKNQPFQEKNGDMLLNIANRNAERLIHLLNDLLDISKLEAGKVRLTPQPVKVSSILNSAITDQEVLAHKMTVDLLLADIDDLYIRVDVDRIAQVLTNLIDNAIKFSSPNGCVELSAKQQDTMVRISIKDYGCGIPASFHSRIFTKFSQFDTSNSRYNSGTGLGLSISKQLTELMGGSIGFTSIEGIGSTFYLEFRLLNQNQIPNNISQ